jgi:hypothetical protein
MFQTTNQLLFVPFCSDPSFVLKKQKNTVDAPVAPTSGSNSVFDEPKIKILSDFHVMLGWAELARVSQLTI